MSRSLLAVALGACALVAAPLSATTIVNGYSFDFSAGTVTAVTGTAGNAATYTGTAADGSTITATVTGWNATQNAGGQYVVSQAYLGQYSGGLGITSGANDTTSGTLLCGGLGACGTQQIDNMGSSAGSSSIDFVRITFSTPVVLGSVSRVATGITNGSLLGTDLDDDFSYGSGTAVTNGQTLSGLTGILGTNVGNSGACALLGSCTDSSTVATAAQASAAAAAQNWYVSASIGANYGGDGVVDAFKLTGISAYTQSAVPEPGTWMMMILGFGGIGVLVRRHKAGVRHLMAE